MTAWRERTAEPTGVEPTGEERIDAALARLGELDGLGTAEHVGVFTAVHGELVAALDETRDEAAPDAIPAALPR
ncbi:hypothetical protein [Rhizohabitans arisaemae]|uniref:hypothetical protein n=1 Tax=Rhizohabitans arisaemae TaxID=2720610 RepID=UPI0024B1BF23|nr:hypothetical protein [Rhizohabitans arisaemae]